MFPVPRRKEHDGDCVRIGARGLLGTQRRHSHARDDPGVPRRDTVTESTLARSFASSRSMRRVFSCVRTVPIVKVQRSRSWPRFFVVGK